MVLDKTGTITHGKPAMTDLVLAGPYQDSGQRFLFLVASAEKGSEAPVGSGHCQGGRGGGMRLVSPNRFEALAGWGACQRQGKAILVGNVRLFEQEKIDISEIAATVTRLQAAGRQPCWRRWTVGRPRCCGGGHGQRDQRRPLPACTGWACRW
ncbi:MAG: hypothetical protein IPO15_14765 [Anaerolineae bacterium]|nr:hypothetical protein [Anaerolineae bacterium]